MADVPALDVLIEGRGVQRGVTPRVTPNALRLDDLEVPYGDVIWVSRRAGLLMVFTGDGALAAKGERETLERLAHALEERLGEEPGRGRLPAEVTREVVVFTAGAAVVGEVEGRRASGLRVAVFTRRGVRLLGGRRRLGMDWPVDEARTVEAEGGSGPALLLRRGESVLRLLYLFPEELRSAIRLARGEAGARRDGPDRADGSDRTGTPADGGAEPAETPEDGDGTGSLEMFARGEVAPPVRSELPEMRLSVDVLQEAAEEAAGAVPPEPAEVAGLRPHFLEMHLVELGEIALGPVLLRKSAAGSAGSLRKAVEAMDAGELREDARAAVGNAANRLAEVFEAELGRLVDEKRAPPRVEEEHRLGVEELEELKLRLQAPVDRLVPLLRELEEAQDRLLDRLRELEAGPPDADEDAVDSAREEWSRCLRRVDRAFERAWGEMVDEAADAWAERLLPSLAEVGTMRRRRLPEWVTLALLALATLLMAAAAMILLVW
mgnify:CR=1 FL=1